MPAREAVTAWEELRRELDAWHAGGLAATLWWRDDDAVRMGPELARLLALGEGVKPALAVIPAGAEAFSADAVVVQHGWAHADNAAPGARRLELAGAAIEAQLVAGRTRLRHLFGARFLPVMVPPWNRLDPALAARLPALGYLGLSVLGPRRSRFETNVHVDVMDWKARRFAGAAPVLGRLVAHLAARRLGTVDATEPTGIMTHHLVHGAAAEHFMAELLETTRAHPAARWLDPREAFAAS
jgi:hypothetical protein